MLGVEDLQERGGRVALPADAELVHLVQQHDGVVDADGAHGADDAARQGADVGAPVAADVRLVAHAAEGDAVEAAARGVRDGAAQGRLAHAGRADEAEQRALALGPELAHAQVFEDAVLDLGAVVVVPVEHLARVHQVHADLRGLVPRQLAEPLQEVGGHALLGRAGRHAVRAGPVPCSASCSASGDRPASAMRLRSSSVSILSPVSSWRERLISAFPLPQVADAVLVGERLLHLAPDAAAGLGDLALHLQHGDEHAVAVGRVRLGQQALLVLQGQVEHVGDGEVQRRRLAHGVQHHQQGLALVAGAEEGLDVAAQVARDVRLRVEQRLDLHPDVGVQPREARPGGSAARR